MALEVSKENLVEIYKRGHLTSKRISAESEKQECMKRFEKRTDDGHFQRLVEVVFFQHTLATNVEKRLPAIAAYLGDYKKLIEIRNKGGEEEYIVLMKGDKEMFRDERKMRACIDNAFVFDGIVQQFGSFNEYILSFDPWNDENDYENLDRLLEDLDRRFVRFGAISPMHFLVHYGFPVIKPDSNIMRTFYRIGLTKSEKDYIGSVKAARRMAEATGVMVNSIDTFVTLGMKKGNEVCGKEPKCGLCDMQDLCRYCRQSQNEPT